MTERMDVNVIKYSRIFIDRISKIGNQVFSERNIAAKFLSSYPQM